MATWTRQPQEQEGSYFFLGTFYATSGVHNELSVPEILSIYKDVRTFALDNKGVDYLQIYVDEKGRKLYFIDQLNAEMIASGRFQKEDNHCTLLWNHEY